MFCFLCASLAGSGGRAIDASESAPLSESPSSLLLSDPSLNPGDSEYVDDRLADIEGAFGRPTSSTPTGRRGMVIAAGIASFGSGGRGEC